MKIWLKNVRLAFPNLWEATKVNGEGKAAFSASFILPRNHPQIAEIKKALRAVADAKWGAKGAATYTALEKSDKLALHDGDTKAQYAGFEGNLFINARNETRPTVKDTDGATPLVQGDGKPYGGCYVWANVEFWAQDNQYGKRINATLRAVQFLRDGESFGGGSLPASDEEFADLSEGAADDDDPTK